jgi:hypothetical protein
MEVDHDLAALLSRTLTLDPTMAPELRMSIETELEARGISYSISQHYHHSSHTNANSPDTLSHQQEMPRSMSEPARPTCEMLLRQNGIDPATLLPPQIQLFRIADSAQQDRLIELWRICPPNQNVQDPSQAWTPTSVQMEEDRTRQRLIQEHCQQVVHELENQPQSNNDDNNVIMSLDGTPVQSADGSWGTASQSSHDDSEPYMVDGYMELMQEYGYDPHAHGVPNKDAYSSHFAGAYTPATDPVYRGVGYQRHGPAGAHMEQMDVAM